MTLVFPGSWKAALTPAAAAATALVRKVGVALGQTMRVYAARRQLAALSHLSDHMLKDIGLERGDLRDAASLPFPADPTRFLVIRAVERRAARRPAGDRIPQSHREAA